MAHRLLQIGTGILLGLAVVAGYLMLTLQPPPQVVRAGVELHPDPYPAPQLTLVDLEGRERSLAEFDDRATLVFFGFANCPDVCPITLMSWTRALERLEAEGLAFQGVFVSVDPQRDTPQALRRYMENFHPSFVALTGSRERLDRTAEEWSVYVEIHEPADPGEAEADPHAHHAPPEAGGGPSADLLAAVPEPLDDSYGVTHTARTFVVSPEGLVVRTLAPFATPDEIVDALRPLLAP